MVRSRQPPAVRPAFNRSATRAARSGPRSEDAQPNESVNRRQRQPPTVSSATHNRRPWWVGRAPNRVPFTHQHVQSGVREHAGSTRHAPSFASVTRAAPHARPRSLANVGSTGCPNTAQSSMDTRPGQPGQGHSASTSSMPTSASPAPKRRKLEGSPVEIKREIPTETMASNFAISVSRVSSETLVGDHKVKVERGISPELYSQPRLNTSGSKRYAPLPPECRKSHPNHTTARTAWARKEQEALRRLGLRVLRTFIREDGMVIDWEAINSEPTDIAAVIERALLLNDAAIRDHHVPSTERATSPLTSASQSVKRRHLDGGNDVASAVEIAPHISLKGPGQASSVEDPGSDASRICGPSRISSMDRRSQSQTTHMDTGDNAGVHTPTAIARFPESDTIALPTFSSSPRRPRSPIFHQSTSNALLHPTSSSVQMRASSSQSTRRPHDRSPSTRPSPSPSHHALDTLHHILQLKRQISRSSSSTVPPAVSPTPSCPLPEQKLYPAPKEPRPKSLSKRAAESSADIVAAALNESAWLSQRGSSRASASSTPLRVYKKRRSPPAVVPVRGNGKNPVPRNMPGHQKQEPLSPERHSSPPIEVLGGGTRSHIGSPVAEHTPNLSGDEFDELDLHYPPSPIPPFQDISRHPSTEIFTEPPRPVEPTESVGGPSLRLPSPEEKAALSSAALQYLERYCQTFDKDRRALAEAYAPNATFSCSSRNLRTQGRDGILNALTALGHCVLCSRVSVEYDVLLIPGTGVLFVVLGTMFGAQDDRDGEIGYTMSFVLQPGDHGDRVSGQGMGQWPLVATMHQIVLREGS